jgi:hypothetical protein
VLLLRVVGRSRQLCPSRGLFPSGKAFPEVEKDGRAPDDFFYFFMRRCPMLSGASKFKFNTRTRTRTRIRTAHAHAHAHAHTNTLTRTGSSICTA